MDIVIADDIEAAQAGEATRKGRPARQNLMSYDQPDGFAVRMVRSQYQGGEDAFETPRHHHPFSQIRWAERGAMNYALDQDISEGDLAYFPRGAYYGPQHRDYGIGLTIQFGFDIEMLGGRNAAQVYREQIAKLRETGRMEDDGLFVDADPVTGLERRRDPGEAVIEALTGQPYRIPPARYETPILLHPAVFSFYDAGNGVQLKTLGAFYDQPGPYGDLRIEILRLAPDATFDLPTARTTIAWTTTGGLKIEDRTYPRLTCVHSPLGELATLQATDTVEAFIVHFPRSAAEASVA
jgi:hypothetical protein